MDYVWKDGKWISGDTLTDLDLIAITPNGAQVTLKILVCDTASEMLDIWLAPNGNKTKLIRKLKSAAIDWGRKVRTGNGSIKESWTELHTNMSARLKYSIPTCTLTKKERKLIMCPTIKVVLPRSGITSSIATEIRDRPHSCGGAEVLSLYHYQGTSRTSIILEHLNKSTFTSHLTKMCSEDLMLDIRLYANLVDIKLTQFKNGY